MNLYRCEAIDPSDTMVGAADLQVGDIIVARHPRNDAYDKYVQVNGALIHMPGRGNFLGMASQVTRVEHVDGVLVDAGVEYFNHEGDSQGLGMRNWKFYERFWIRARVAGTSVKLDNRFPHDCPYCRRRAYVSALSVEHADGRGCL